jgi:DTW domain-containing protein YfiP
MNCPNCHLYIPTCICNQLHMVELPFTISVIRHFKERYRNSNSAYLLSLSSNQIQIQDYGDIECRTFPTFNTDISTIVFPPESDSVLYSSDEPPQNIIVLDGSWKHARRIYRRHSSLRTLPHLQVIESQNPLPRIRKPTFPGGMCTMEATIQAIIPFLPLNSIQHLIENYQIWIEQVRINTGIRAKLAPGESFKEARIKQDIIDGKFLPTR